MSADFWNLDGPWRWLGDLHAFAPAPVVGLIVTVAAILCGILIGAERERRDKPAGMRTLALICVGAVIFTQASLLIGGDRADPSRIAAQVVTGVGFLGAGAIIRERGLIIGVTTGAAIWATAAIGVVIGAGYVAAGLAFTLVVLLTLFGLRALDTVINGPCKWTTVLVRCSHAGRKPRILVESLLEDFGAEVVDVHEQPERDTCELTIRYCGAHRQHKAVLQHMARLAEVRELQPADTVVAPLASRTPSS